MAKFKKEVKHNALNLYAEGVEIGEIAKRIGCHRNTIDQWRAQNDPADWEAYKAAADSERMEAALAEIRKKAAETTRNQLEDSIDLRSVTKFSLLDIAKRIKADKLTVDKETVGMLRDIERIFNGVQQQQNTIFDLPTHRVKIDNETRSTLAVNQKDIKDMSNQELMSLIFGLNAEDKNNE